MKRASIYRYHVNPYILDVWVYIFDSQSHMIHDSSKFLDVDKDDRLSLFANHVQVYMKYIQLYVFKEKSSWT